MSSLSTHDVAFRNKTNKWLAETGEISSLIRFSAAGGSKSFEFFHSIRAFTERLAQMPPRTCVTVFRSRQLPLRGCVDNEFVKAALAQIPEDTEYLISGLEPAAYGKASWFRFTGGVGLAQLQEDLADHIGEKVAVGIYPPWLYDTDDVISAVVPEQDGSVVVGVY